MGKNDFYDFLKWFLPVNYRTLIAANATVRSNTWVRGGIISSILCKRHREIGHLQKSWREIAEAASSKIIISIISISLSVAIMSDEKIKKVNVFFVHSIRSFFCIYISCWKFDIKFRSGGIISSILCKRHGGKFDNLKNACGLYRPILNQCVLMSAVWSDRHR